MQSQQTSARTSSRVRSPFSHSPNESIERSYLEFPEQESAHALPFFEQEAIGLRVATIELSQVAADVHLARLLAAGIHESQIEAITDFPEGVNPGDRLSAILSHVDNLTCASRQGKPGAMAVLLSAGLTADEIMAVSKRTSSLSFQIRVMATIQALDQVA
jgi:uncharacterized protein YciW